MQPPTGHEAGPWPHTGAVLAGGASRRMGQPKHLAGKKGETWIERAVEEMGRVTSNVVIAGAGALRQGLVRLRGHICSFAAFPEGGRNYTK